MREIKFRAKVKSSGDWIIGDLVRGMSFHPDRDKEDCVICQDNDYAIVDEKTVGQFTGLQDKNEVEVWEGDRVKKRVHLVEGKDYIDYICDVKWNGWCYCLFIADKQMWGLDPITVRSFEVIGNIHEVKTIKNGTNN